MSKWNSEEISLVFPTLPMPEEHLLSRSVGFGVEDDLSIIKGKKWNEIKPGDFRFHFEIMLWLSPSAFRYYMPSVITCSSEEVLQRGILDETELVVDYTLGLLVRSPKSSQDDLWKVFSKDQLDLIGRWILLLDQYPSALPYSVSKLISRINRRE